MTPIFLLAITSSLSMFQVEQVELFNKTFFRGTSERFSASDEDLSDNSIGNVVRSITIPPNCKVTLFANKGFTGRSLTLSSDSTNLESTAFGRTRIASIRVVWAGKRPGPRRKPQSSQNPQSEPYAPAQAAQTGVTLYRGFDFSGREEVVREDLPNLAYRQLGDDRLSSLRVPPGYVVTLYQDSNFRGAWEEIRGDDRNLTDNRIGDNTVSSIRVRYEEPQPEPQDDGPGVTLYRGFDFSGREQVIRADVADLAYTHLADDRLSSLRVPPGYVVTLYRDSNFRGTWEEIRGDDRNLTDNRIGDNTVSSIRVRFEEPEPQADGPGVTLYRSFNFSGRQQVAQADLADLDSGRLGDNRLSSLQVPPGYVVTLYKDRNFRGSWEEIRADDADLTDNPIGDNTVSSIRIRFEKVVQHEPASEKGGPGVIFYRGFDFSGREQVFHSDVADLRQTHLGTDRISSLRVPPGYVVTLYEHQGFRGISEEIRESDRNLTNNRIGDNTVSSIRIAYQPEPEGVTLFEEPGFRGRSYVVNGMIPNLGRSEIGNDRISSLRVPPGFIVTLYERTHFSGISEVLTRDDRDLRDNNIGDNQLSSIRVRHKDDPEQEGVVLFRQANFRGKSQMFYGTQSNLQGSTIGNDTARSIQVPPGCVVTLFEHANFRGRREEFRGSDGDLANNKIGMNRTSSLKVRYETAPAPARAQIVLYEHENYKGRSLILQHDIPDLAGSRIGNDELSSIKVPLGWKVTLYSATNYRGDRLVMTQGRKNLRGTTVGNDRVRSIRIARTQ